MKKLSKKELEKLTTQIYQIHFNNIQVNVMDLGKIYREIENLLLANESAETINAVMGILVTKFRKN